MTWVFTTGHWLPGHADPFYAEFEVAGPLYHLLNHGLLGAYSSSQVQPEYRWGDCPRRHCRSCAPLADSQGGGRENSRVTQPLLQWLSG